MDASSHLSSHSRSPLADDDALPLAKQSAVALRYHPQDLPRVVAKGKGYVAQQILATAESAGVPLHHDPALTQALSALDIQQAIPRVLFEAVAQVLVFAFEVQKQAETDKESA